MSTRFTSSPIARLEVARDSGSSAGGPHPDDANLGSGLAEHSAAFDLGDMGKSQIPALLGRLNDKLALTGWIVSPPPKILPQGLAAFATSVTGIFAPALTNLHFTAQKL